MAALASTSELTSRSDTGDDRIRVAKVLFDFDGDGDSQLSIKENDEITLVGEVTDENWIFAKHKNGNEGYIPDQYFEVIKETRKKTRSAPKKKQKSIEFSDDDAGSGYIVEDMDDDDGIILEQKDTFSLFTYQMEWFTIVCLFIGGLLSFMYSSTQPDFDRWRMSILSWFCFVLTVFAIYICGINRELIAIKQSTAITRFVTFLLSGIILLFCYPVGIGSGMVCVLCSAMELRLHFMKCKPLPNKVANEWCSQICGGFGGQFCNPLKIILFISVQIISLLMFGVGYVNGYAIAIEFNDKAVLNYINPTSTGMMYGFGRMVTINLFFILWFACVNMRKVVGMIAKKLNKGKEVTCNKNCTGGQNVDSIHFLHRCFGYDVVFGGFLHLVCVYFTYEDSGSTHTFMDAFGIETFATGFFVLLLLALIVASSNDTLSKTNSRLFHQTHWQSIVMVIVLFAHGKLGLSTYYWQWMLVPFVFYVCDIFVRYARSK